MKIDVLTLFPNIFNGFISESIMKKAIDNKIVEINFIDYRNFSNNKHNKVDDTPYGGGNGMVLQIEPIYNALNSVKTKDSTVILMTPQGIKYDQKVALDLKNKEHLIFICGHYEGYDERIRSLVDMEISIGDYVLTNGEIPSMAVIDSVVRLLDNVIASDSHIYDSFNYWRLEHPHYTKPAKFLNMEVPEVLLNGNHKEINNWRLKESLRKTYLRRPDLIDEATLSSIEIKMLKEIKNESN